MHFDSKAYGLLEYSPKSEIAKWKGTPIRDGLTLSTRSSLTQPMD